MLINELLLLSDSSNMQGDSCPIEREAPQIIYDYINRNTIAV